MEWDIRATKTRLHHGLECARLELAFVLAEAEGVQIGPAHPNPLAEFNRHAVPALRTFRLTNEVRKFERALQMLELGQYGICGRCGQGISSVWLDVDPASSYCVPCLTNEPSHYGRFSGGCPTR